MSERVAIKTLWFWRSGEDGPEMLEAWDEVTVDRNPEGFEEACRRAYDEVKFDDSVIDGVPLGPRRINVLAEWNPIERAFWPPESEATSESESA